MIVGEHDSLMHEEYEEHEPEIGKDHQESFQLVVERLAFAACLSHWASLLVTHARRSSLGYNSESGGGLINAPMARNIYPNIRMASGPCFLVNAIACQALEVRMGQMRTIETHEQ